jgi:hypothetical protein
VKKKEVLEPMNLRLLLESIYFAFLQSINPWSYPLRSHFWTVRFLENPMIDCTSKSVLGRNGSRRVFGTCENLMRFALSVILTPIKVSTDVSSCPRF